MYDISDLRESCITVVITLLGCALPGCCQGIFGPPPSIKCPETAVVGDEVVLTVRNVDDGLHWTQRSDDGAGGVFIVDDMELEEFRGGPDGDSRTHEIVFRAQRAGTVVITAEEVFIGPPICFPPYPRMSSVACEVTIVGAPCETDADCDDGLFCNGLEVCFNDLCYAGEPSCGGEGECYCWEEIQACVDPCFTDESCDDGEFCNGEEWCDGCQCQAGEPPCEECDEETGCRP